MNSDNNPMEWAPLPSLFLLQATRGQKNFETIPQDDLIYDLKWSYSESSKENLEVVKSSVGKNRATKNIATKLGNLDKLTNIIATIDTLNPKTI